MKNIKPLLVLMVILAIITSCLSQQDRQALPTATITSPLRANGNIVVDQNGSRVFLNGVNVEAYRDYDGCPGITNSLWTNNNLSKMIAAMKSYGLNAVRLNFSSNFINESPYLNFTKYMDIAQAFANAGIYVVASDHSLDYVTYSSTSPDWMFVLPEEN